MATVVLQYAGAALGTALGGPLGGIIGRAAGAIAGNFVDQQLFGNAGERREGPRLSDLRIMASEEGAAIPQVWGRMRLSGQVIWATAIEETAKTQTDAASSKGGPSSSSTEYSYFANFAVGLAEGVLDRIGRVWADGKEIDVSNYTHRFYSGSPTQNADSLIVARQGPDNAPAYRGLSYVVFERLPLAAFGNRLPQLSFEVFAAGNAVASGVRAVSVIPGSTEFGYDTTIISRDVGKGATATENAHVSATRSDWTLSIDDLQGTCKNLSAVSLVAAWFGTDLRCGNCQIKPGVDNAVKATKPDVWRVSSTTRAAAHMVSQSGGGPAYGGTPSDASVIRAILDLKARGLKVIFYPFVLMDIAAGNSQPNPYGGTGQSAYPWRGRITASVAPGQAGTPDKTAACATQIQSFVGTAAPSHFNGSGTTINYTGPAEWSYRRMILHYAKLCQIAGGVDGFIIGSEMRGLSTLRSVANVYPFVNALMTIASDVKAMLPSAAITYAADWSEYFGHQPGDGTGDVYFHLDPLWASSAINAIGIDNYMPLSDWRDGSTHLDAGLAASIYDRNYLKNNITGGEGFDWYYASQANRNNQVRTTITDGAYGKPWMFRYKDVKSWWNQQHFNRPLGIQSGTATAWIPQSKPIWFTEVGCPAIDKGTNEPNAFYDAKSTESALPRYSGGQADDLIQQRYVRSLNEYWSTAGAHNPVSSVYGLPMVDAARIVFWAWDARPYPAFPVRTDIWSDGINHARGHWLNGRLGAVDLGQLIGQLCEKFGVQNIDVSDVEGQVDGFAIDRPMSAREALEGLLAAFSIDSLESDGILKFRNRKNAKTIVIAADSLISDDDALTQNRGQESEQPNAIRVVYAESGLDYRNASVERRRSNGNSARDVTLNLGAAVSQSVAQACADVALQEAALARTKASFVVGTAMQVLEPGDVVRIGNQDFRIVQIVDGAARKIEAVGFDRAVYDAPPAKSRLTASAEAPIYGQPDVLFLDLAIATTDKPAAPWMAAQASPWPNRLNVFKQTGPASFNLNRRIDFQATMGTLSSVLQAGPSNRLDRANTIDVVLNYGALASISLEQVLNGENIACVGTAAMGFEIIQFQNAELIAPNTYRLSNLLRGQAGSGPEVLATRPVASEFVLLNTAVVQPQIDLNEASALSNWRIGPATLDHGHAAYLSLSFQGQRKGLRPLSPVHLKSRRIGADIDLRWIRRTRLDGDSWELNDVPLGETLESYQLEIRDGSTLKRRIILTAPNYIYSAANMIADFGSTPANFTANIAQISAVGDVGASLERIVYV